MNVLEGGGVPSSLPPMIWPFSRLFRPDRPKHLKRLVVGFIIGSAVTAIIEKRKRRREQAGEEQR